MIRGSKTSLIATLPDVPEGETSQGTDTEEVKKKTQSLIQASMKLGEAVYKSQQKSNEKSGKNQDNKVNKDNDGKEKDNVVDAEVVDPKEDKEKRA